FDALELLTESLIGRVLAEEAGGLAADTILDEENLIKLGESGVNTIILRGSSLSKPETIHHLRVTEEIRLGTADRGEREAKREAWIGEYMGKELAKPLAFAGLVIPAGGRLERDILDALLDEEE
ncbi:hypothetical protein, partial [Acinetobacter baumannii]|uniref:hypothetical protein n=1 Tax=Acinetobacter baumannii TaxID=470 RepID=UPI000D51F03C